MGAIGTKNTLLDIAKKLDPNGQMAQVAEVLSETNPIVQDMPMVESNLPTGNRVTIRTGLPSVAFTRINQGVDKSKSTTKQMTDTIGILSGRSEFDRKLRFVANGNIDAARWDEDQAFIESMNQTAAATILYGNEESDEAAFTGLITRLASTSAGDYKDQVIAGGSASGQTDNTSMLFVDWSPRYVHGIYPMGSKGGLDVRDLGEQDALDSDSKPFRALVTDYEWALGVSVRNHKHLARICNIDVSLLAAAGESGYSGASLINLMITAFYRMDPPNGATRVIYAGAAVCEALDKLVLSKSNLALSIGEWAGQPVTMFRGSPVRRVDQFTETEARIT